MKIENFINFSKYKRFFAFGCSFTNYKWPMWPEMISQVIEKSYNFGCAGSDNRLIYLRVLEADCLYNFNEEDLIVVMWSNVWRDTKFDPTVNWQLQRVKDDQLEFRPLNFIFRDFCYIKSIYHFLENKKVDYDFLSMSGFTIDLFQNYHLFTRNEQDESQLEILINQFTSCLTIFKDSMFETVYDYNWQNPKKMFSLMQNNDNKLVIDNHPTPSMSLEYLQKIYHETNFDYAEVYMNLYQEKIINKVINERIHPQYNLKTILSKSPLVTL